MTTQAEVCMVRDVSLLLDDTMATLVQVCDSVRDCGFTNAYDILGIPRQDSMGMSYVLYFPYAVLDEVVEED